MTQLVSRLPAPGLLAVALLSVFALACGADDDPAPTSMSTSTATTTVPSSTEPVDGEILVFAASSLTDAFTAIGDAFESAYPGTSVVFNFASSSALAVQITEGGPAGVFASADLAQMTVVTDAVSVEVSEVFARNLPVVAVPAGSSEIAAFEDLAADGVRLVLAGEDVPIGRYARQVLANASGPDGIAADFADRVLANLQSNEANVRAVLTKVQLGEADAGVVYATDIRAAKGEVTALPIPEQYNVVAEYPIAVLSEAPNPTGAAAFLAFVLSSEGAALLEAHGFTAP